jgi:hypothetical protein
LPCHDQDEVAAKIEKEYPLRREGVFKVKMNILKGSYIEYFINGKSFGTAFSNIYQGNRIISR